MAAKQGITAHITQSADDARRAVINRAPQSIFSHSWISNLNTTCTIKSAPPRTPDVMSLLSTKSGWLVKRNESHVWQRRYCCVVPHTFLYYFDAEPSGQVGEYGMNPDGEWSYSGDGQNNRQDTNGDSSFSLAQPVGIIDLECYSQINRSSMDGCVMEVTGDNITNPDLRSFFFEGENEEDCNAWTSALLSDRHQALRDEREAYKQVCESFPLQLQAFNEMVEEAETKAKENESEAYQARSNAEEGRKMILNLVRECLEKLTTATQTNKRNRRGQHGVDEASSASFRDMLKLLQSTHLSELDSVLSMHNVSMNGGAPESVQILINLLSRVIAEYHETYIRCRTAEQELNSKQRHSRSEFDTLLKKLEGETHKLRVQDEKFAQREEEIDNMCKQLETQKADLQQMLRSQQLESQILSKKTREKVKELNEHKKILKREVIELRATLDDLRSESDLAKHQKSQLEHQVEREKERRKVIEDGYGSLREQLNVQERVWSMMSDTMSRAGGSVAGSINGDPFGGDRSVIGSTSFHPRDVVVRTANCGVSVASLSNPSSPVRGYHRQEHKYDDDTVDHDNESELGSMNKEIMTDAWLNSDNISATNRNVSHDGDVSCVMSEITQDPPPALVRMHLPFDGDEKTPRGTVQINKNGPANGKKRNSNDSKFPLPLHVQAYRQDADSSQQTPTTDGSTNASSRDVEQRTGIINLNSTESNASSGPGEENTDLNSTHVTTPKEKKALVDLGDDMGNMVVTAPKSPRKSHRSKAEIPRGPSQSRNSNRPPNPATSTRDRNNRRASEFFDDQDDSSVVSGRSMSSLRSAKSQFTITGMTIDGDASSVVSNPSKRLSVAERARQEAENGSGSSTFRISASVPSSPTSCSSAASQKSAVERPGRFSLRRVRSRSIEPPQDKIPPPLPVKRTNSQGSFLSVLGNRLTDVIDNSVLGVKGPDQEGKVKGRDENMEEEEDDIEGPVPPPPVLAQLENAEPGMVRKVPSTPPPKKKVMEKEVGTPLQIRQQMQRKKQLAFLKERGLIREQTA